MKNKKLNKKYICIIDTDPGVDDSAALTLSLFDDFMDIKLVTTTNGNLDLDTITRNALHVLEKFGRTDIPLAKGASRPLKREPKNAIFAHKLFGMGNYIPPEKTKKQPIKESAVEAMYKVVKENAGNICIIMLGPTTNTASLILTHPDVVDMISHIYYEGCAAYGNKIEKDWKNYISFNASSDPDALKIIVESGIPLTMVPSRMGRDLAHFTEEEVLQIRDLNSVGEWIYSMYSGYWERGYADRRIATNDTCAVLNMRFPELFKTKRAFVEVDTEEKPGRTTFTFSRKGNVEYVYKVNRKKMHEYYYNAVKKLDRFTFVNEPIKVVPGEDIPEDLTQAEQLKLAKKANELTIKKVKTSTKQSLNKSGSTKNKTVLTKTESIFKPKTTKKVSAKTGLANTTKNANSKNTSTSTKNTTTKTKVNKTTSTKTIANKTTATKVSATKNTANKTNSNKTTKTTTKKSK